MGSFELAGFGACHRSVVWPKSSTCSGRSEGVAGTSGSSPSLSTPPIPSATSPAARCCSQPPIRRPSCASAATTWGKPPMNSPSLALVSSDRLFIVATICWSGEPEAGARALAPLLAFGPPVAVGVSRRAFNLTAEASPQIDALLSRPAPGPPEPSDAPGVHWLGGSLGQLGDGAIHAIAERVGEARGGWSFSLGRYLHGKACRAPAAATPLVRPRGRYTYHFDAWWGGATDVVGGNINGGPSAPFDPHLRQLSERQRRRGRPRDLRRQFPASSEAQATV